MITSPVHPDTAYKVAVTTGAWVPLQCSALMARVPTLHKTGQTDNHDDTNRELGPDTPVYLHTGVIIVTALT